MTLHGYIHNGEIALDERVPLPEGARVRVEVITEKRLSTPQARKPLAHFEPVDLPGGSLAEELVRDRR